MVITHKLQIDLQQPGIIPPVCVVQGDTNTREISVSIFNGGTEWNVQEGVTAAVAFRKPDGTRGLYDKLPNGENATSANGNTITAVLAPQVLTCAGTVAASIVLHDSELDTLATFPFPIVVHANPAAGKQVSNSYYYLQNLEQVNAAYSDLLARVGALEQSGAGLTNAQIYALDSMFRIVAYTEDPAAAYANFRAAFGLDDAHAHSWVSAVTKAATCTMAGVRTYTCSCGASYTEEIKPTGHHYADGICISCGAVDPDADGRTLLHKWDFTKSLTDTVGGATAVLTGVSQDADGLRFDNNADTVLLGNLWSPDRTIEVDFGADVPDLNYTKVLVMFGGSSGFSYGVSGGWGIYANGTWNYFDPQVKENGYFANSTLKLKVSADGKISVYRNDDLLLTTTLTCTGENQQLNLGRQSDSYNTVYPMLITGCRIYEGVA